MTQCSKCCKPVPDVMFPGHTDPTGYFCGCHSDLRKPWQTTWEGYDPGGRTVSGLHKL